MVACFTVLPFLASRIALMLPRLYTVGKLREAIKQGGVLLHFCDERFDLPVPERILASRHVAPELAEVVIECAPDGSWLRVGDRELRNIRGQQQDLVLTWSSSEHFRRIFVAFIILATIIEFDLFFT